MFTIGNVVRVTHPDTKLKVTGVVTTVLKTKILVRVKTFFGDELLEVKNDAAYLLREKEEKA